MFALICPKSRAAPFPILIITILWFVIRVAGAIAHVVFEYADVAGELFHHKEIRLP